MLLTMPPSFLVSPIRDVLPSCNVLTTLALSTSACLLDDTDATTLAAVQSVHVLWC